MNNVYKIALLGIFLLFPTFIFAESSFNFLTKGLADTYYCQQNGICNLSNFHFINVTVISQNITSNISMAHNKGIWWNNGLTDAYMYQNDDGTFIGSDNTDVNFVCMGGFANFVDKCDGVMASSILDSTFSTQIQLNTQTISIYANHLNASGNLNVNQNITMINSTISFQDGGMIIWG